MAFGQAVKTVTTSQADREFKLSKTLLEHGQIPFIKHPFEKISKKDRSRRSNKKVVRFPNGPLEQQIDGKEPQYKGSSASQCAVPPRRDSEWNAFLVNGCHGTL